MILAMEFKNVWRRGLPQWHDHPTEFHKNLLIGSKVVKVVHTRADRMVSL
jgi:hypothetical protein